MALAKKAARSEKSGENAQAYIYYSEAAALQPRNRRYKGKLLILQARAARESKPQPKAAVPADTLSAAQPAFPPDVLTPQDVFDSMTEREMSLARELKSIPSLGTIAAKAGKQNFDLNEDARELFDKVATRFGLQTVFDGDYPTAGAKIGFRVEAADYREALNELEAATSSFVIPISSRVFMVAKDSQQKRNELEQTMAVAVPVPQAVTAQELTELAQVVRQTANVEKIAWDTSQARIIMRDRVSRVLPAVALLQQLLSYRAEVMIELEFIQVGSSDLKNYGFNVTNSLSAVYLGNVLHSVASPAGVANLLALGGGKTLIGIGVAQAQAMFNETYTSTKSLYRAQIRSVVGQPATLHVGEKFPVITGGYFGAVPAGQAGQNRYAPPPQFTFEDLGLTLKVTPFVHGSGEVTLQMETGFEVLTGQAINNIPVIGRRNLVSQVRLRSEEWAVIGGIMNATDSKAVSGFLGLASIPVLGYLFRQNSTDKEENNVLIGVRPHLMSLPPDQIVTKRLRVGSEMRPYTPL